MERPKLAIPGPELHSVRRETISMLGKTYGCGQCSGKYSCLIHSSYFHICMGFSCTLVLNNHTGHVGRAVKDMIHTSEVPGY